MRIARTAVPHEATHLILVPYISGTLDGQEYLVDNSRFLKGFVIKKKTNENFSLDRCYANGHAFGSSGTFHTDWNDETGKTALLYANDTWRQEWGGKTVFNIDGEYHYTEFHPNSLVIFPGLIPHRAEDPTKFFLGLRKTVAWKLISTDIILNHWTDETNWQ